MSVRPRSLFAVLALLSVLTTAVALAQSGLRTGRWAHEDSKLTPDARVTWGQLDNGLRYAILPHAAVPGSVALRFVVHAGSIDEGPDELGIAHFTEHMAFQGTRNFPYEQMVGFFHRLGMEFGSDVNAITTFDHTAYALDYRDNSPEMLVEGLRLFRDFADGILFRPEHIEQESRVILSELRGRDGMYARAKMGSLGVIYRGLRFPERNPGGSEADVRRHTQVQFIDFYQRCYRPDLMVVVAVGDIDPATMAGWIREHFGDLPRPTSPIPKRDEGRLDPRKALRAGVFPVTGVEGATVTAASVLPPSTRPDSREAQVLEQQRAFVGELLSQRLGTMIPDAGAGMAVYENLLGHPTSRAMVAVAGREWARGLTSLDEVIRATWQQGFEEREIDALRRFLVRGTTVQLGRAATVDPAVLAESLTDSIVEHRAFVGPETSLAWKKEWAETFTARDAQRVFRGMWDIDRMAFHLDGGVKIDGGEAEVVKAVQQARRSSLRTLRPEARREVAVPLRDWGTPGTVIQRTEVPGIGARLMRFGNNVRLNFVPSSQTPGTVSVVVRVGHGLLDMPGNQPALKEFGLQTLLASGTPHFTAEKLSQTIEDHLLGFSLDTEASDAFSFRGHVTAAKLDIFLEVVTEFLSRPLFETSAHRDEKIKAAMARASGYGMEEGMQLLYNHLFAEDARFTWATFKNYLGLTVTDVRNWLQGPLTRGYVEVTLVGDISEEQAVRAFARSLGALPVRDAGKLAATPPRPLRIAARPGFTRIEFVGEQHQAVVIGTWPVEGTLSTRDKSALNVLTKILELRIREKIREDLGLAYSPMVSFSPFNGFPDFGWVQAQIDSSPAAGAEIADMIEEIAATLARDGVNESEFIGSRGILASQVRRALREDGYLLGLLQRAQERPDAVEQVLALQGGIIDTTTIDEVNAWAARVLPTTNCHTAAIVPKPFIGIFQTVNP